ncbi:4-(cytidine 5'-diphospho)-2-C-methyl-D-erythritol kinase [Buchnera aphidicola]|uniref:4-(cytidine 5'-diphospho)-2-C-methyl-D-erythritol kinase n=1 Tax=Buchnera aphidicola TaxID=9 RepID=UPI0021C92A0A|nr:4-(cytidine 5'-diphospho)-2-C-methyl-D-erythritol kinase [Buchnera aphidicola]
MINTTWFSPAKINLFLYVTGIRSDGYHYIQTFLQLLDYGDTLKIIPNQTGFIQIFNEKKIFLNVDNIIFRAAALLKKQALILKKKHALNYGVKIFLKKRLPIGSGLGGGSSNAATTLIVLNKLWNVQLTLKELSSLGVKVGADIPFFIMGHTALAEGIGDVLYPIKSQKKWYLVVYPNIPILTRNIFSNPLLRIKKKTY